MRDAIREGRPFDLHFRQRRPDASQRILRSSGGPVFGPGGVLTGIEGFAQDVTELKRAEDHQRAVAALGQAALGGLPLDELMERATEIVAATLELDHVSVFEVVPGGERLLLRAGLGWPLEQIGSREAEVGNASHAGSTLLAGEPVVVEDWEAERRFRQPAVLAGAGVRSSAAVVIGDPAAPYGALAAHSVHPGAVGQEHVMFLQAVANVLDSAVARLRAEEEIAEQAAARGRLVAQALDAEERTRRDISEMLHDGPLQDLLALNQELLRLPDGGEHLERAQAGIGRAIGALREIMVDLHPVAFEVAGLESALGAVADQQARHGAFACELTIDPSADGVRDDLVIALARELLTNAAKHAAASRVRVSVRRTAEARSSSRWPTTAAGSRRAGSRRRCARATSGSPPRSSGSRRSAARSPSPAVPGGGTSRVRDATCARAPTISCHQARSPGDSARASRRRATPCSSPAGPIASSRPVTA